MHWKNYVLNTKPRQLQGGGVRRSLIPHRGLCPWTPAAPHTNPVSPQISEASDASGHTTVIKSSLSVVVGSHLFSANRVCGSAVRERPNPHTATSARISGNVCVTSMDVMTAGVIWRWGGGAAKIHGTRRGALWDATIRSRDEAGGSLAVVVIR